MDTGTATTPPSRGRPRSQAQDSPARSVRLLRENVVTERQRQRIAHRVPVHVLECVEDVPVLVELPRVDAPLRDQAVTYRVAEIDRPVLVVREPHVGESGV